MRVNVRDGVSVFAIVGVIGVLIITSGVGDSVTIVGKVGGSRMIGVAVTIPGVPDGIGVQTGKGCGDTFQVSHAESKIAKTSKVKNTFFIMAIIPVHFLLAELLAQIVEVFSCNSFQLGSVSIVPSGKTMVGTLLYPLFMLTTNSVASSFPSNPTRRYSILLVSKNFLAR